MATFSVNIGQITEATAYPLNDQTYFNDILDTLKDNEDKLIDPKDLRDALLSIWSSIPFKETSTYSIASYNNSYIGIDSSNPSDRDYKKTIFIGKRSYSGTYSYLPLHDIMNSTLLSSDVDMFLFNTKIDTVSNTITRASILAGKNKNLYSASPFIQSQVISGATQSLSIDFVSKSGQLNITNGYIYSTQSTTIINNLPFPSIEYASASASDSTTFFWRGSTTSGTLSLEQITLPVVNTIGTSSEAIEIFGSPVNVNGYSLELDDSRLTPISLGGIPMGTSFSNYPIVEVLRRIIYPYLPPLCSITIDRMYVEVGTLPVPILTYSITKRTNETGPISLFNMNPGDLPPIAVEEFTTINGVAQGIIPTTTGEIGTTPIAYTILVPSVDEQSNMVVASASTFIQGIYPYFYGVTNTTSALLFQNLTKLEENISDKILSISGDGTFYFAYDADYPDLSQILDQFGNNIISNFSQSIVTKASPQGYWNNKDYKIYQWITPAPIYPANYQFRY